MFIHVNYISGNGSYSLKVDKDEKISAVKTRIGKIEGTDPEEIWLKSGLDHLDDDDKKISDYDIKGGSMIKLW
jgi:hypothetical protein